MSVDQLYYWLLQIALQSNVNGVKCLWFAVSWVSTTDLMNSVKL